jgi:hypothetical protein
MSFSRAATHVRFFVAASADPSCCSQRWLFVSPAARASPVGPYNANRCVTQYAWPAATPNWYLWYVWGMLAVAIGFLMLLMLKVSVVFMQVPQAAYSFGRCLVAKLLFPGVCVGCWNLSCYVQASTGRALGVIFNVNAGLSLRAVKPKPA